MEVVQGGMVHIFFFRNPLFFSERALKETSCASNYLKTEKDNYLPDTIWHDT